MPVLEVLGRWLLVACVRKQDGTSRVVEHEEEYKCQFVKELVGFRVLFSRMLKCLLALNAFFFLVKRE